MDAGAALPVAHGVAVQVGDPVWRIPAPLRVLAPEATGLLDAVNTLAWRSYPTVLLEQLRLRIAALIGDDAGRQRRSAAARRGGLDEARVRSLGRYHESPLFDPFTRTCLEFTEQFVLDVGGPIDDYLPQLSAEFPGDRMRGFVSAVYLTEFTQRLDMIAGRLLENLPALGEPSAASGAARHYDGDADAALSTCLRDYQAAVVRLRALEPVVTELVRLRCARTHHCRICQTLRLADARAAGADDTTTAKIDFYETSDLDDRAKLALRITDLMISDPRGLDDPTIERARATFTPAEIAELCLDITKWSTQKIHVARGTDGADALPTDASGMSYFAFDPDGDVAGFSAEPY